MGWFSKPRPSSPVPTPGAADIIASPVAPAERKPAPANQCVELGKINYVNLEGSHGSTQAALEAAQKTGRPMFVNFVEFPG